MKKTKKILSLLLALTCILALFAGCGSSSDEEEEEETETEAATSAEEETAVEADDTSDETETAESNEYEMTLPLVEDSYTFTWWCMFNSTNVEDRGDCYPWEQVEEITGISIEWSCATDETATTQIALMATSGDITDFVSGIGEYFEAGIPAAMEAGLATDITEVVQEYCPNYWNYISADESLLKANLNDDGILWSFRLISMQDPPVPQVGTSVRADMLAAVGFDSSPVTYEEWDEALAAIQVEYPSVKGSILLDATGLNDESFMWVSAFDIGTTDEPFVNRDGEVVFSLMGDEYEAYIRQMHEFYEKGYIFEDFMTTSFLNMEEYVLNDELVVFDAPAAMTASLNITMEDTDFELIGAPAAKVNADDTIHLRSGDDAVRNGGDCAAISECCENVELACQLINYIWSDEGIILFNYGEEGVSFEYDDDGNPQLTDLVLNNPDGLSQTATSEIYLCVRCIPILKDNISMYDSDTMEVINVWMDGADTDHKISENVSLTADESTELSTILSDMTTYIQEMTIKFITGGADIDTELETYNEMLISMGVERATEIEQEAVDRYNSR